MDETTYPRLCGGTFVTLLLSARKKDIHRKHGSGGKNTHRNHDLVAGLININKPKYYDIPKKGTEKDDSFKVAVSAYLACRSKYSEFLPFTWGEVANEFDNCIKLEDGYENALTNMLIFVDDFLRYEDKRVKLVKELLELIESDESIDPTDEFCMGYNLTIQKMELCSQLNSELRIYLPAFLLGVWHFIVTNIDRQNNTIGKKTVDAWHGKLKEEDKRGKYIGPADSGIEWNIKLVDARIDIKKSDYTEDCPSGEVHTNALESEKAEVPVYRRSGHNNTEIFEKEKVEEKKSLLDKFNSAISDCRFVEFIRSEPLREFVKSPEIDADELESRRVEYEDEMSDIVKLLPDALGADLDIDDLDDIPQGKILPYSINKLLSPTLLKLSERFVEALTKMIPDDETSEHPAHDSILEFKDNLKLYNDYLNKHLEPKEDHFVYKLKSVVRDEEALKEAGSIEVMDVFVSTLIKHRKTEENRISLEYAIDAVDDDINDRLAGFNSTTNHFRDMLFSLYKEIQDELFLSPDL